MFKKPDEAGEASGNDDDENFGKGDGSPPAFGATTSDTFGASKAVKLNIESRPPEKSPYEKVFNNQVEKFKLVTPSVDKDGKKVEQKKSMGRGHFSLEIAETNGKKVYICVFRNLIGKNLYQGTLHHQLSKKRRIEEKAMKNQLKLALMTIDPTTKKMKVDHLVISFSRSDDLKQFEKDFEDAITTLKQQAPAAGDKKEESKKTD